MDKSEEPRPVLTYNHNRDRQDIRREYGFSGKEDAGKYKLQMGFGLLEKIIQAPEVSNLAVTNLDSGSYTGIWSSYVSTIRVIINKETVLTFCFDARHYSKPLDDGTHSELKLTNYIEGKNKKEVMQNDLVKKIRQYLNNYVFEREPKPAEKPFTPLLIPA